MANETEYVEYLGEEPHGVAFLTSHAIPRTDPLWKRNDVANAKELVWERDPLGPGLGQPGSRMLLPVSKISPEQLAVLEKVPGYKRVKE